MQSPVLRGVLFGTLLSVPAIGCVKAAAARPLQLPAVESIERVEWDDSGKDAMRIGTTERAGWSVNEKSQSAVQMNQGIRFTKARGIFRADSAHVRV